MDHHVGASEEMTFSSLNDPVDIARAEAALEAAWHQIKASLKDNVDFGSERLRLADIVVSLIPVAEDEADLARRAIERYFKTRPSR
jgi:glutathione S-transferase